MFSPKDTVKFFEELGVPTHTEDNNRVFPSIGKATAIKITMQGFAQSRGVKFLFENNITGIDKTQVGFTVTVNGKHEFFDAVVIATGGLSFPVTGSTGDGLVFAGKLRHNIIPTRSSLCGLKLARPTDLQGMSTVCEVQVLDKDSAQITNKAVGNMLFTKTGVSGPVIYETVAKFTPQSICGHSLKINFAPDLSQMQLEETLQKLLAEHQKKKLIHVVRHFMPLSVADWVIKTAGLNGSKLSGQITKTERNILFSFVRGTRVVITDFEDIAHATITRGGIDVHEVDPKTMQSKLIPNLFFIGEVLDVDALSGGFNLQIAFSTAVACARALEAETFVARK